MNFKKMPGFFKHAVNTGRYGCKICPLGNWAAFFLAAWVIFRDKINDKYLTIFNKNVKNRFNKFVFFSVMVISFFMNLNAFIYFIPVFYYEFYFFKK